MDLSSEGVTLRGNFVCQRVKESEGSSFYIYTRDQCIICWALPVPNRSLAGYRYTLCCQVWVKTTRCPLLTASLGLDDIMALNVSALAVKRS